MKKNVFVFLIVVLCISSLFVSITAKSEEQFKTEGFSDTTKWNGGATTAFWDTLGGALRLHPFEIQTLASRTYNAQDIDVDGDYAFVAIGSDGIAIIDISHPDTLMQVSVFNTDGEARGVAVVGDYAYVADYSRGLTIIDIANPSNPDEVGQYDGTGGAEDVAISGNHAYIANNYEGLLVLDVSDPAYPQFSGSFGSIGTAHGVAVSGDYAYLATSQGLHLKCVADPENPTHVNVKILPGDARDVAVDGGMVYVVSTEGAPLYGSLRVFEVDVTKQTSPQEVGCLFTGVDVETIEINGDYAYIGSADGVIVVDISVCGDDGAGNRDPAEVGRYEAVGLVNGICITGTRAYRRAPRACIPSEWLSSMCPRFWSSPFRPLDHLTGPSFTANVPLSRMPMVARSA